jgi:hypothetical protein
MIESIVNKIITDGITNFSKVYEAPIEQTQIRVYLDDDLNVKYDVCKEWLPIKEVTFKEILNVKFDLLQKEALASPVFKKSVLIFAEKYEVGPTEVSVFIFVRKSKTGICIYAKNEHKETQTLTNHIQQLGL